MLSVGSLHKEGGNSSISGGRTRGLEVSRLYQVASVCPVIKTKLPIYQEGHEEFLLS